MVSVSYTHLTPEEWDMVEEVFKSFMAEGEEGHECCGKHKDCLLYTSSRR